MLRIENFKKHIALFVILIIMAAVALIASFFPIFPPAQHAPEEDVFVPGPPSPEVVAMLKESKGFAALVSYTDRGFEPPLTVLEVGQTVRFTNNSTDELWISAEGTAENPEYPGSSDCGGSAFDSCLVLKPRDFWEFTFVSAGAWGYHNNLDKEKGGVIEVVSR